MNYLEVSSSYLSKKGPENGFDTWPILGLLVAEYLQT